MVPPFAGRAAIRVCLIWFFVKAPRTCANSALIQLFPYAGLDSLPGEPRCLLGHPVRRVIRVDLGLLVAFRTVHFKGLALPGAPSIVLGIKKSQAEIRA